MRVLGVESVGGWVDRWRDRGWGFELAGEHSLSILRVSAKALLNSTCLFYHKVIATEDEFGDGGGGGGGAGGSSSGCC